VEEVGGRNTLALRELQGCVAQRRGKAGTTKNGVI